LNEISKPVKTNYGYHILKLLQKDRIRLKPYDEMKNELVIMLQNIKHAEFIENYIENLFDKYNFHYNSQFVETIRQAYVLDRNIGHIEITKIPNDLRDSVFVSYANEKWSLLKFFDIYNRSSSFDRLPFKSEEDLESIIRRLAVPYLMFEDAKAMGLESDPEFVKESNIYLNKQLEATARTKLITSKVTISEEETKQYYEINKAEWNNQEYDRIRSRLRMELRNKKIEERKKELLKKLKRKYDAVYNDTLIEKVVSELNRLKMVS
jgi:hypothetical protein